ncbi:MAG: endonuclease III [Nanoarchaeota archaeon]|jgi:endonuclease III|nr:endonuclease III [Nanoarchaeota archaeon]|tara:strand:+ start:29408 stop:30052 length:645 start_codon:yes stop_codon:yes gene_type:complete
MKVDIDSIYRILKEFVIKFEVPSVNKMGSEKRDVFKVLIATILSARSKDEITEKASNKLFSEVKNFEDLRNKSLEKIKGLIKPIRFYNNKAKYLKQLGDEIKDDKIPDTIEELVKLPGVGRKTANLVLIVGFKKKAVCVDVHLNRIFNRLGYIKTENNFETEMELRKKLPKKYWMEVNKIFVSFGQNLCRPISPHCSKCPIIKHCKRVGVEKSR